MAKSRILGIKPDFNFRACIQPFPNNPDICDMDLMLKFRGFYLKVFKTRIGNDDDEIETVVNRYIHNELPDLDAAQDELNNIRFLADYRPKWATRRIQARDCHLLQLSRNKTLQLWPVPAGSTAILAYQCNIMYPNGNGIRLPDIEAAHRKIASVKEDAIAAANGAISELCTIYRQHLSALQKQE